MKSTTVFPIVLEGEIDGLRRHVDEVRRVTGLRVTLGILRHLKEELASVRALVCRRRGAWLLAARGSAGLVGLAGLDDLAGARLQDRAPVERAAVATVGNVHRRVDGEAVLLPERRTIVAARAGDEKREAGDPSGRERTPHGSTTSCGVG
jgi:hypothetical protein